MEMENEMIDLGVSQIQLSFHEKVPGRVDASKEL